MQYKAVGKLKGVDNDTVQYAKLKIESFVAFRVFSALNVDYYTDFIGYVLGNGVCRYYFVWSQCSTIILFNCIAIIRHDWLDTIRQYAEIPIVIRVTANSFSACHEENSERSYFTNVFSMYEKNVQLSKLKLYV